MKKLNDQFQALAHAAATSHANYLTAKRALALASAAQEKADGAYREALAAKRAAAEAFAKATKEVP